jgi:hypothetical protein
MNRLSKAAYWAAGLSGTVVWSSAIIGLSGLPLPTQLALAGMAVVTCLWGHVVLFPKPAAVPAPAPAASPLPTGRARTSTRQAIRHLVPDLPPGELPILLREPFEEAARMEAHRLAEAISAAGLFGLVNIRLQADGTALVAPVRAEDSVRVPTTALLALAHRVTCQSGAGDAGAGTWPGASLGSAIAARLAAPRPAAAQQPGPPRGV